MPLRIDKCRETVGDLAVLHLDGADLCYRVVIFVKSRRLNIEYDDLGIDIIWLVIGDRADSIGH